jgi:uncharacterized damage-inducible protein DinB
MQGRRTLVERRRSANLIEESIQSIQELATEITQTVVELPEDTLRWKPTADAWSIAEILGHVQEATPYWAGEIQRVVANPDTEWGRNHQDESRLNAVAATAQRGIGDLIAGVAKAANAVVAVLRKLNEQDLQIESPSRNPRWGVKPMSFVLDHLIVSHLRGHRDQIKRTLDQFAAAHAGDLKK